VVCLEYVNKAESNKKFKQNGLRTFRLWMDSEKNSMINGIDIESAFDQRFPRDMAENPSMRMLSFAAILQQMQRMLKSATVQSSSNPDSRSSAKTA